MGIFLIISVVLVVLFACLLIIAAVDDHGLPTGLSKTGDAWEDRDV